MHHDERLVGRLPGWQTSLLLACQAGARTAVHGQDFDTFPRSAVTRTRRGLRSMDSKISAVSGLRSTSLIMRTALLSVSLSLSLSLSASVTLSMCVSLCLSLSLSRSLSVCMSVYSMSLSVSVSLYLCLSLSLLGRWPQAVDGYCRTHR